MTDPRNLLLSLLALAALCLPIDRAAAAVWYVDIGGSNANAGTSWATAWADIDFATNNNPAVAAGDEIRVGAGTYTENVVVTGHDSLTLTGGWDTTTDTWAPATSVTTITAAAAAGDVLALNAMFLNVAGVTVTGGDEGITVRAGSGSSPDTLHTITRCKILNNTGRGIEAGDARSSIQVVNCLIANNGSDGVYMNSDNANYANNHFFNCTIVDNGGNGLITVNTFHRYTRVKNCLIANNSGYGIKHSSNRFAVRLDIEASCVYNNTSGNIWAQDAGQFGNTHLLGGNIAGYPFLVGGSDYHLTAASPCVDYGVNLTAEGVTDDLDGTPRTGAWDIGCYEYGSGAAPRYLNTYVDAAGSDTADGSTTGTAKKTIGAALAVTAAGGTCHVPAGNYAENVIIDLPDLTLLGAGRDTTTISGAFAYKVWLNAHGCWVTGFTLEDGTWAALAADGPDNTLPDTYGATDCRMQNSKYGVKGISSQSRGLVEDRRFVLERCIINDNESGVVCSGRRPAVKAISCLVVDNLLDGIFSGVDNSAFVTLVYNCTIAFNGDNGYENGHNWQAATLRNCILSDNIGYGVVQSSGPRRDVIISDMCFANNGAGAFSGSRIVNQGNIVFADPAYAGPADFSLAAGSPCIDVGRDMSGDGVLDDVNGSARPIGGGYEIGAYEVNEPPPVKHPITYADISRPDDSGDGLSWATAKKNIGSALVITQDNGLCNVAAGTYSGTVYLPPGVTLQGVDRDATILTNASNTAVLMAEAGCTVSTCTISGSLTGVAMSGAGGTLANCTVSGNSNYGVDITGANATISGCLIEGNGDFTHASQPWNSEAGIHAHGSTIVFAIEQSIVRNNTAHGIKLTAKTAFNAVNCAITGNSGEGIHGLVDNAGNNNSLVYCTIAGNGSHGYSDNHSWARGADFTNCVIANNGGYGIRRNATLARPGNAAYYVTLQYSCLFGNAAGATTGAEIHLNAGMVYTDPLLTASSELQAGSSALNTALDTGVTVDLVGTPRPNDAGFDMGAYELILVNEPPTAVCQNITVDLDASGNATIAAGDLDGGATDPEDDPLTFSASQTAFTCDDLGANAVTLTVDDGNDNSDQCTATVTVTNDDACQALTGYVFDGLCNADPAPTSGAGVVAAVDALILQFTATTVVCDLAQCRAAILAALGL